MNKICVVCGKPFNGSHSNVLCCSRKCGNELRQTNFDNALRHRIGEPISDWLKHHYTFNHWTYKQICNALQINTRTLMRYMREYNISITNPSESVRLQWVRNPQRHNDGLKIAVNGAPKRADYLRTHPQGCETALLNVLLRRGIKFEFQYVVGSYILDFAFPEHYIDIELDNPQRVGKYFNSPKIQKRTNNLQKRGWKCLYFHKDTNPELVADFIESLACSSNYREEHAPTKG